MSGPRVCFRRRVVVIIPVHRRVFRHISSHVKELRETAYRVLAKRYHPDNPQTGSAAMMAKINVAIEEALGRSCGIEGPHDALLSG